MKRSAILPLFLVSFIDSLGYSIVLPFLVFVVTRFGGDATTYGLLAATYPALQLVGAPILGRWSDVYGRRKILLLSEGGTLVAWIVFLVALYLPSIGLALLFVARALDGVTGGNAAIANAYVADVTREEERTRAFGRLSIAANLGFVAGPALAGILGSTKLGETLPVMAAIGITVVAVLTVQFLLPESRPNPARSRSAVGVGQMLGREPKDCFASSKPFGVRAILRMPGVRFVLLLYFVIYLGFNFFYTAFPVHAVERLSWSVADTGAFFAVLSLMMVLVQGPVLSFAAPRLDHRTLIVGGNLLLGVNFLLLLSPNKVVIYGAAALFALGNGLMWPSVLAVLARVAGKEHQGAVQGVAGTAAGLASIAGLVAGGLLYEAIGAGTFVVSAVIIVIAAALALAMPSDRDPKSAD